ncbi:PadR family transcriptional regulator [Pantoea allii]|uniref:PadR family transcriptional regulator n=1 Tax=Pantoea allii TaxID=574096 RepID=A0ABS6VHB1_9GAMM|nr:PadR family transcriptional regulator [Pantoea allii]MBW1214987.1 PadR family transcriptional regulator [Pantoea allii]MBW1258646.1 PadR family transcriptional regulator [Pantoea allii]MBW1267867.1 PadR family transcriptional regulator [Pantoea allii]MBW1289738.1 PadR family transcriptional regulator [Pantoea allii]MDJ0088039.1 PadR family transcriptional regulator [Pantoea allii]
MKMDSAHSGQSNHDAHSEPCSGRRKRREKMLDAGEIRLLMLHFISQRATHGYELIKCIEELSKGEYSPSPGIIYPNLTWLEEMDAIHIHDPLAARKAFVLTETGHAMLKRDAALLSRLMKRLSSLAVLVNNRSIPEIEQAIYHFKSALNTRLAQQEITDETREKIVAVLMTAADEINRS